MRAEGLLLSSSFLLISAFMRVVRWPSGWAARLMTLATMVSTATDSSSSSFCTGKAVEGDGIQRGRLADFILVELGECFEQLLQEAALDVAALHAQVAHGLEKAFCSVLLVARSAISKSESSALSNSDCSA